MQLQKRYDEIAGENELDERQDNVMMFEDYDPNNIDESKIINIDDIMGKKQTKDTDVDEEDFHKKFVESFRYVKAPDIDL